MKALLLALALFPTLARAFTNEESQRHTRTLSEVAKVFDRADSELAPCTGLDQAAEAALNQEPARTCVKAAQIYSTEALLYGEIRNTCHSMERFLDEKLRGVNIAFLPDSEKAKIKSEFRALFSEFTEEHLAPSEAAVEKFFDEASGDKIPAGSEFNKSECYLPTVVQLQARKKLLSLLNKHKNALDNALRDALDNPNNQEATDHIFRYLREGESALSH